MSRPEYTDQEVTAALNFCLDLEKFRALPGPVKDRIRSLVTKNRIKPVCFFEQQGFGLRVYREAVNYQHDGGDEVELVDRPGLPPQPQRVDLDGSWVRCPAAVWEKAHAEKTAAAEGLKYGVMNGRGTKFVRNTTVMSTILLADSESDVEWTQANTAGSRSVAAKMSKATAQQVADAIKGIVVEL